MKAFDVLDTYKVLQEVIYQDILISCVQSCTEKFLTLCSLDLESFTKECTDSNSCAVCILLGEI